MKTKRYHITAFFFLLFPVGFLCAEPRIVFEKEVFDFGEIMEGDTAVYLFHFKNEGDTTLEILDIRATCNCTVTELKEKLIEPGKNGIIEAVFHSSGRKGKITKSIYVTTNDKKRGLIRLKVTGKVKRMWGCEPTKVDFGEIRKNGTLIDTVTISSISLDTIKVDSITTEPPYLTSKIVYSKGDSIGIEVLLETSEIENERFIGVIRFYSNIPEKRMIIIPVYAKIKEEVKNRNQEVAPTNN